MKKIYTNKLIEGDFIYLNDEAVVLVGTKKVEEEGE